MSNFEKENIMRQDGSLPDLGLKFIDEHLVRNGKSVEALSNPEFRVFMLWTTIGQYRGSADYQRSEHDDLVINDARYSQLLSTWTHESRRVNPREKIDDVKYMPFVGRFYESIDNKAYLEAYEELTNIRKEMPEVLHPDIRFDLYETLRLASKDTLFEELVLNDMIQETMPGGSGFCDNTERLRRYLVLAKSDAVFFQIIDEFINNVKNKVHNYKYFEDNEESFSDICRLVAARGDTDLANYLIDKKILNLDDELLLFNAFI